MPAIQYLKRSEVDDAKWNACIDLAPNGLIYGYTFYLDAMCTAWDALVLEDYSAVMPLPWRKKWSIHYLYQPFGVAQAGIFGQHLTADLLYGFLKNIPSKFRYWDMPLNFGNDFKVLPFSLYKRTNVVLPLLPGYEQLRTKYRPHIKRNIKKAIAQKCSVERNIPVDVVIALAKKHAENWGTTADYEHFKKLYQKLVERKQAITYVVKSHAGAELASAVFFFSHQRAYYILPGNHPEGRLAGTSHLLLDHFIQDHAGENIKLDFEGSDAPGVQFFYTSFGAVQEPYTAIRHNCLPWFIKWLK